MDDDVADGVAELLADREARIAANERWLSGHSGATEEMRKHVEGENKYLAVWCESVRKALGR